MNSKPARNPYAFGATFRSGGGPHKDSRKGRGGTRNEQTDLIDEWLDIEAEVSGSHPVETVIDLKP